METILATALGQEVPPATAEEKRLLLSRLLGRVAHEIRNPLSSLDIHLQLLEEDLATMVPAAQAKLADRLQVIHGELHRLDAIVEQFLRLAGPSNPNLAQVDLAQVISRVRDVLGPEADSRQIEIVTRVEEGLPLIEADADQLIQATLNLAINGVQAVGGAGRVELRAYRTTDGVVLEVRDTGPGVAATNLGTIFEPFFTTKAEGSGLGLWIVQQIVAAHRGTMRVVNVAQGGAAFTICFPLHRQILEHGKVQD